MTRDSQGVQLLHDMRGMNRYFPAASHDCAAVRALMVGMLVAFDAVSEGSRLCNKPPKRRGNE